jgi:PHD/YefM family antitoxin component YafN of YafNO toxin-antitoxin module
VRVASVAEVASDFAVYLKASEQEPIVVTRNGKPVAVLIRTGGQEDLERLLMGHSPKLQGILEAARKRFREGAGIPHDTFWEEVEAENAAGIKKRRSVHKTRVEKTKRKTRTS